MAMSRRPSLRIAVIGAGLGGLAAGVALRQAGFDVDVYEQAPELTEIGGGINLGPNAVRVLYRLGLRPALDREAVRPLSTHQRRWQDGRTLQLAPLNPRCEELYGAPHLTVHRADLLAIIASGFAPERLHLGHRLVGLSDKGDRVEAWFENSVRMTADVVIGADGINSTVRAALLGEEAPRFAGCVAYRATIGRALQAFAGWHPQLRRIIGAADTCFIWALFDREPLPRWSIGRITLLGDACHPMYPFMGQGAAQAMEDGATLAACLSAAGGGVPDVALRRYEELRRPRVTRLQGMSRANKTRFHLPDGPAQEARDAEWARAGDRSPDALRWLYEFDATELPRSC